MPYRSVKDNFIFVSCSPCLSCSSLLGDRDRPKPPKPPVTASVQKRSDHLSMCTQLLFRVTPWVRWEEGRCSLDLTRWLCILWPGRGLMMFSKRGSLWVLWEPSGYTCSAGDGSRLDDLSLLRPWFLGLPPVSASCPFQEILTRR